MNCDVIGDYNFLVNDWKLVFTEKMIDMKLSCKNCEIVLSVKAYM